MLALSVGMKSQAADLHLPMEQSISGFLPVEIARVNIYDQH
jgi:hypothetical protein